MHLLNDSSGGHVPLLGEGRELQRVAETASGHTRVVSEHQSFQAKPELSRDRGRRRVQRVAADIHAPKPPASSTLRREQGGEVGARRLGADAAVLPIGPHPVADLARGSDAVGIVDPDRAQQLARGFVADRDDQRFGVIVVKRGRQSGHGLTGLREGSVFVPGPAQPDREFVPVGLHFPEDGVGVVRTRRAEQQPVGLDGQGRRRRHGPRRSGGGVLHAPFSGRGVLSKNAAGRGGSTIAVMPPEHDPIADSRYHRQTLLPEFGRGSVKILRGAHAAIVGCGALGTVSAQLLARAGVGVITIVDRDTVEHTNLQRQLLFTEADARAGVAKAIAAAEALRAINGDVRVRAHVADATAENVEALLGFDRSTGGGGAGTDGVGAPDVLLDGADNFATRFLLNDLAVKHGVPYVYAGGVSTRGALMTVVPRGHPNARFAEHAGPCLRCVLGGDPISAEAETCDTVGVLGPVTTAVAAFQAVEAMKVLLGRFDRLRRHLLAFDPWHTVFSRVDASGDAADPECPCCGGRRFDALDAAEAPTPTVLCGGEMGKGVQLPGVGGRIELARVADAWRAAGLVDVRCTTVFVRGGLPHAEGDAEEFGVTITLFVDGRAIFRGLDDPDVARSLYARYVGG